MFALQQTVGTSPAPRQPFQPSVVVAWLEPACGTDSGHAPCGFFSILHLLDIIAVILAVILVVVLALAIYTFRRNRLTSRSRQKTGLGADLDEDDDPGEP